jgi:hypothetical protein
MFAAVACTASPPVAPSPTPSASPVTSPTPGLGGGSPSPGTTADPTPQPTITPTEDVIDHPIGSTDVILRMDQGGGFVFYGFFATQAPQFTLYGDGTFLLRPLEDRERPDMWTDGMPRFLHGRMNEAYIQALLAHALTTGRLLDARDQYPQDTCADCGSTFFTINAAGLDKTVTVVGLEMVEPTGPDAAHRRGFAQLAQTINELEERARAGEFGEVALYDPGYYRITLFEAAGEPVMEPVAWPWDDVMPADFEPEDEFAPPTYIMSRDNVALLLEVPSGGHTGIWAEEPDGTQWQIGVRPLLLEEMPTD